ncbi:preprotein translocase subunit SecG [candidate division WWE3 bacterium]|nr:preprotein translocase subunit SecG [candidate division WWE3 bacterium]
MANIAKILQLIFAVSLTGLVLIQAKGGGLSNMVGSGAMYRSRRGLEKIVFIATIVLGILFSFNSLFLLYLN